MSVFLLIASLLSITTIALLAWPLLRTGPQRSPLAAVLAALLVPILVWAIYPRISTYDWATPAVQAAAPAGETRALDEAVAGLEQKLANDPGNEEGWVLLGSSYLATQRPVEAVQAYQRAIELSQGNNLAARLGAAEAQIAVDPAALSGVAGQEIEAILARDPGNPKALWYGGMLALSRGDITTVRARWQALLDLDPPAEIQQIIIGQLAALETGETTVQAAQTSGAGEDAAVGIAIEVSISNNLRDRIAPTAPLFIFLRDPAKPGPPLAVVRRIASELPLSLRISDADLMMPGGAGLATLKSAALVARIANAGNPVAQAGDLFGEATWQGLGEAGATISIVIDQIVQ